MDANELRRAGFGIYTFGDERCRAITRDLLDTGGVVFDFKEFEEEVAHHKLFFLAAKRLDPTLKQRLPDHRAGFPKGD